MAEKKPNLQKDFMIETIKERPVDRKKLLRRTVTTATMAVIFGLIACVTFLVLEPVIKNRLYPDEKPQIVVFPEDQEEMSPQDMLAENLPTESTAPSLEEPPALEEEQIQEILSEVVLDRQNYQELYSAMSEYVTELSRYMVTVTAVNSKIDWFNDQLESSHQASGLILADNGKELLILADAQPLRGSESLVVSFSNGVQIGARIKRTDEATNLAVLCIPFSELPESMQRENMTYPGLGISNGKTKMGVPVIALGSPMGVKNSVGYGMITSVDNIFCAPDRNYRILQTDINGSKNAGGVLFNLEGRVVGIITGNKTNSDVDNVIYAYGITDLKRTLEKLFNEEPIAYLGVTGIAVTLDASLSQGVPNGAFVTKVDLDSPAMLAGIQQGDVIINMNGRNINTFSEYTNNIMSIEPGKTINVTVMRRSQEGYKDMQFTLEIGEAKQ